MSIILDSSADEAQFITTKPIEMWVSRIEYIAIILQFTAIITLILTQNRAIDTDTVMIGGVALQPFQWVTLLLFFAYFIFLIGFAPLIFQARGLGQILASYVVVFVSLLSLFGAFFKIQAWQYGSEMTTLALFFAPIAIIIPIFYFIKDGKTLQTRNFIFNMIARIAGIFMYMLGGIFIIIAYKVLKPRLFKER